MKTMRRLTKIMAAVVLVLSVRTGALAYTGEFILPQTGMSGYNGGITWTTLGNLYGHFLGSSSNGMICIDPHAPCDPDYDYVLSGSGSDPELARIAYLAALCRDERQPAQANGVWAVATAITYDLLAARTAGTSPSYGKVSGIHSSGATYSVEEANTWRDYIVNNLLSWDALPSVMKKTQEEAIAAPILLRADAASGTYRAVVSDTLFDNEQGPCYGFTELKEAQGTITAGGHTISYVRYEGTITFSVPMSEKWEGSASTAQMKKRAGGSENYYYQIYQAGVGTQRLIRVNSARAVPSGGFLAFQLETHGFLRVQKTSANADLTKDNACYSLAGAVFGVYLDAGLTQKAGELISDADGFTQALELAEGTYYLKETKAPRGFLLSDRIIKTEVNASYTQSAPLTVTISDVPLNDPIGIRVVKKNGEENSPSARSLAGTRFRVDYYDAFLTGTEELTGKTPVRSWVIEARELENGTCAAMLSESFLVKELSDDLYYEGSIPTLPLGTIVFSEVRAAEGYVNDAVFLGSDGGESQSEIYMAQIRQEGSSSCVLTALNSMVPLDGTFTAFDDPIRGDISFTKVDGKTGEVMAGVTFRITMLGGDGEKLTQEECIFYALTDDNGYFESTGGTFPYGRYLMEEMPGENNEGYEMASSVFEVTEHDTVLDLGEILNFPEPSLTTILTYEGTHSAPFSEIDLIDTVRYEDLQSYLGEEILVRGFLVNKATGEPVRGDDGVILYSEKTFIPEEISGSIEITFRITEAMAEKLKQSGAMGVTAMEEMIADGRTICEHKDINSEAQTVYFVKIGTTARADGKKEVTFSYEEEDREILLADIVRYEGLEEGETYLLTYRLINKENGQTVCEGEVRFTPETQDGETQVEIHAGTEKFLPQGISGKVQLVVTEQLFIVVGEEKVYLAEHTDLEDEAQTVTFLREEKKEESTVSSENSDQKEPEESSEETPKKEGHEGSNPGTGDSARIVPPVLMLMISAAAMTILMQKRRRDQGE